MKEKWKLAGLLKGILGNIGLIYFFILPVYLPIRALGVEFESYVGVLNNDTNLILFFSQITIVLAFTSLLLSFFSDYINKNFFSHNDTLFIHANRVVALFFSCAFILSSYFVLNPSNRYLLYLASGAHYFIIAFFQLLIRSELSTYKNNQEVSVEQANNYFGVCLNVAGIFSLFIFSYFYKNLDLITYAKYGVWLQIGFIFYLAFVRNYLKDIKKLITTMGVRKFIQFLAYYALALSLAPMVSVLIMKSGIVAPIITIGFVIYLFSSYRSSIKSSDLGFSINVGLGYGLILSMLTGSIFAYFFQGNQRVMDEFNFSYSYEPLISLVLAMGFALLLINKQIEFSRSWLYKKLSLINLLVPLVFLLSYLTMTTAPSSQYILLVMFSVYAFLEYFSTFYMIQVAQLSDYNHIQGTRLTSFNTIVMNGLCPSLIYISVSFLSNFTQSSLDQILKETLVALLIISVVYNSNFIIKAKLK